MTRKTRFLIAVIAVIAVTCAIVTIAQATPVVGVLVGTILSQGTINDEFSLHVRVSLPAGATETDGDGDRDDDWHAKLSTNGPTDIEVPDVVYSPGGQTAGILIQAYS